MKKIFTILILTLLSKGYAQSITSYFAKFPYKNNFISLDSANEHTRINIDEKNAFIGISYDDSDYGYEYGGEIEFTYFVRKDKQKVFGYMESFDGPSSFRSETRFYTLLNNEWTETSVLPDIDITDFDTTSTLIDSVQSIYRLHYALPQHGTDVIVNVKPVGETDVPFDFKGYFNFIESLPNRILKWNRDKGVFELSK